MFAAALAQIKPREQDQIPESPVAGGASLPAPGPHRFQLSAENPCKAPIHSSAGSHKQTQGTGKGGKQGRGEAELRLPKIQAQSTPKFSPRAPQTPASTTLGAGKPGCFKKAQILATSSSFPGGCNVS